MNDDRIESMQIDVDEIRALRKEVERLRKLLQQVLTDAQAQDVLLEWWHALECEKVRSNG